MEGEAATDTYSLLLRNGQSIPIVDAVPGDDDVEFVAAAQLAAPLVAWLQRSSDGATLEIQIESSAPDVGGRWRYAAKLASVPQDDSPRPVKRSWGFMRRTQRS